MTSAFETPFALQNFVQQMRVFAAMLAVDQIVSAHDRQHARVLHRRVKRRQINFAQRSLVNDFVDGIPLKLLVVRGKMFGARRDALSLLAFDVAHTPCCDVRNGSSPMYSKLRPHNGVRWMFRLGPSMMFLPRCFASWPMTAPYSRAKSVIPSCRQTERRRAWPWRNHRCGRRS